MIMSGGAFDYKQYQNNKKGWNDFSNEDKIIMPEGWQRYNDKTWCSELEHWKNRRKMNNQSKIENQK